MNFIKKYLKFTGIMFINLVISYILALFLFENTPWKNDIAGVFESPESLSLLISTILFMIFHPQTTPWGVFLTPHFFSFAN